MSEKQPQCELDSYQPDADKLKQVDDK